MYSILRGDKFCTTHPFVPFITRGYQCAVAVVWASILPVLYIKRRPPNGVPATLQGASIDAENFKREEVEFGVSLQHDRNQSKLLIMISGSGRIVHGQFICEEASFFERNIGKSCQREYIVAIS